MRVVSWNINGIRSFKTPIKQIVSSLDSDILCFQETKISRNQVDESTAFVQEYLSFFSFPRYQSGYSGVASYCDATVKPFIAQDCFLVNGCDSVVGTFDCDCYTQNDLKELDSEGRVLITGHQIKTRDGEHKNLYIFNLYCPHNDPERPERSVYKLNFHRLLEKICYHILAVDSCNHVLIIGDINISHKRIDHCEPNDEFESSPHRQWLDEFLAPSPEKSTHFIDIFRQRHPSARNAFTCWNTKSSARKTNFGTRIDIALCDSGLYPYVTDFEILTHIEGSDHCPIRVVFGNFEAVPSSIVPNLCTKFWPELGSGKRQTSILRFFQQSRRLPVDEPQPQTSNESKQNKKVKQEVQVISRFFKSNGSNQMSADVETINSDSKDSSTNQYMIAKAITAEDNISVNELNKPMNGTNEGDKNSEPVQKRDDSAAKIWKMILPGVKAAPLCTVHKEPTILLTVTKPGKNKGRKFYACARPAGFKNDPASSCEFFRWYKK